jgi:hypothetical protein
MNREAARALIDGEILAFQAARKKRDIAMAWRHLERAHIVSQPFLALHLGNHWAMLKFAFSQRDVQEIIGQLVRLALAPLGSFTGRIPVGNTGRSNVSAFEPMEVPDDLAIAIKAAQP